MQYESNSDKRLTEEEILIMEKQNSRLVSEFVASKIEVEAKKHWDLFYKRNEDRFFKDRHWTPREFEELFESKLCNERQILLEVGCGVGNFIFPLIEEGLDVFIYACDLSPRAIKIVQSHPKYSEVYMKAFQADITEHDIVNHIPLETVDIITLVFILSAIHPSKFSTVLNTLHALVKPGGVVFFRDYGLYDMTQLRFKPGHKISENLYMRQDGTRSYFFSLEVVEELFTKAGFVVISNSYIHRKTVNKKEGIDVPRIFVQGKFQKPAS